MKYKTLLQSIVLFLLLIPMHLNANIEYPIIKNISIDFFSNKIDIDYNIALNRDDSMSLTSNDMKEIVDKVLNSDIIYLVKQIQTYEKELNMSDWAVYLLLHKIGDELFTQENETNIFVSTVLNQMGYDVNIAFKDKIAICIASVDSPLYNVENFTIKNKVYYTLDNINGQRVGTDGLKLFLLPNKKTKKISFNEKKVLKVTSKYVNKSIKFNHNNKNHSVEVKYNTDLTAYYNTLPQTHYKIYKHNTYNTKHESIKKLIHTKNEVHALDFLLSFVQKGFKYKTDKEVYGYEKLTTPEEILNSEYSDCEDRVIYYSYLVENILGLKTIYIKYDGHLSVAVKLSQNVPTNEKLAYFKYKGEKYISTDPTYTTASIGVIMPINLNKKYTVIE